jgi:hypothetical protein
VKTIEAGLIVSQLWAERRRRVLSIVPTTLRNQWVQELEEKFFIPALVFDSRSVEARRAGGAAKPSGSTSERTASSAYPDASPARCPGGRALASVIRAAPRGDVT